jgi:hypothetical protein
MLPRLILLELLHHKSFPVVAGYCQYEPNVLKLTPPLSITIDEAERMCESIKSVLQRSHFSLAMRGARYAAKAASAMTSQFPVRRTIS